MDISASAASLYGQYQNLIDRFQSGDITYREAAAEHSTMAMEARGYMGAGLARRPMDSSAAQVNVPLDLIERLNGAIAAHSEHLLATQTYENGVKNSGSTTQSPDGGVAETSRETDDFSLTLSMPYDMQIVGPRFIKDARDELNMAVSDDLKAYAIDHKDEWIAAANELGIAIHTVDDKSFRASVDRQSLNQPIESRNNANFDNPNSEAEQIFRHIANTSEIAEFDGRMDPKKQEFEAYIDARGQEIVSGVLEGTFSKMKQFEPHLAKLEAAELTPEDLTGVLLTRSENGQYNAARASEKSAAVENLINSNPELRALYDAEWSRTSS